MRRRRRFSSVAALISLGMLCGFIVISWAASLTGAGPQVIVQLDGVDTLQLFCKEGVGHRDDFCRAENGRLRLDFRAGFEGLTYGFQPGSQYTFGDVMFIRNIGSEPIDVTVRVEQAKGDDLYRVLSVYLEEPDGGIKKMFPPDSGDGTNHTMVMQPGGKPAGLSFAFDVSSDWGHFETPGKRYPLKGAVIVLIERDGEEESDKDPRDDNDRSPKGGGGREDDNGEDDIPGDDGPPGDDPATEDDTPGETPDEPPDGGTPGEDPPAGDDEAQPEAVVIPPAEEIQVEEGSPFPSDPPGLPLTGGATWPYLLLGGILLVSGAAAYIWNEVRGRRV